MRLVPSPLAPLPQGARGTRAGRRRTEATASSTAGSPRADSPSPPVGEGLGVGASPDNYLAYADLPGATSFPTNIPAARPATITQAIGLSFSRPNGDATKAPTFTALSHTDARAAEPIAIQKGGVVGMCLARARFGRGIARVLAGHRAEKDGGVLDCPATRRALSAEVLSRQEKADNIREAQGAADC